MHEDILKGFKWLPLGREMGGMTGERDLGFLAYIFVTFKKSHECMPF